MKLAVIAILGLVMTAQAPADVVNEYDIIEAVLRDPRLIEMTDGGRFTLDRQTSLSPLRWTYSDLPTRGIQLNGAAGLIRIISEDMMASLEKRNVRSMSTKKIVPPPRTAQQQDRRVGYSRYIWISRPGVSSDGLKAIVVVEQSVDPRYGATSGYTAYLEKRSGHWSVVGRGAWWET